MTVEPRPLRILLSAYACQPGEGSEPGVGWNWAVELARLGHAVWVLTRSNNRPSIEPALPSLPAAVQSRLRFIYHDLPNWVLQLKRGPFGTHLYFSLWQRGVLPVARAAHQQNRFDVIHHLTFGVCRQPSLLHRLGVPFVFGPVGGGETAPPGLRSTLQLRDRAAEVLRDMVNSASLLNPELRRCLEGAALVVAKTPETAAWLRKAGAASPLQQLEIGIDTSRVVPRGPDRQPGQPLRCIFAGRLLGWKGVHLAIDAVAAAVARSVDVTLTIVGKGPMEQTLKAQVHALGLQSRVRFLGAVDQLTLFRQFREHDMLLFPSLHDSSGNVVLEAMAHGLPAVCLKTGGPAMMVGASNGFAIEAVGHRHAKVIDGLSAALARLASDSSCWKTVHAGALEVAAAMTWRAAVQAAYFRFQTVEG